MQRGGTAMLKRKGSSAMLLTFGGEVTNLALTIADAQAKAKELEDECRAVTAASRPHDLWVMASPYSLSLPAGSRPHKLWGHGIALPTLRASPPP